MVKFPETEWLAAQIRLSVFPTPEGTARLPDWWHRVTGVEPNQHTTDRKRSTSLVSGDLGTGTLTLALAPERVDWFLAADAFLDPLLAFSEIGPMIETLDEFSKLAEKWLGGDDVPDVSRIAFGLILHHPEADHTAGYKRLPEYVPVSIEPDWKDFFFQVNIPTNTDSEEYGVTYLNRLSKWSVTLLRSSRFLIGDSPIVSGNTSKYSLRLELDISTPADSLVPLSRSKFVLIYRELVSVGQAIARNGVAHEQYRLK